MPNFIQFYRLREGQFVEAIGSDGIALLDGRLALRTMEDRAAILCSLRSMDGWRIFAGSISRPHFITPDVRPPPLKRLTLSQAFRLQPANSTIGRGSFSIM